MPKTAVPDWAAIRRRYEETDAATADIAADGGIAKADLLKIAKREKWRRQKPRGFPPGKKPPARPPSTSTDVVIPEQAGTHAPSPDRGVEDADAVRLVKSALTNASPPEKTTAKPTPTPTPKPNPKSKRTTATPAGRRRLLDRLVAAISLKLEQLERRMAQDLDNDQTAPERGDAATATDHERETRAIGALIDNLGKVTEMETAQRRSTTGGKAAVATDIAGEADRYRRELAERLAKIVGAAEARA